jgi:cobalt-zinc-cadmium resistance protein CzcA
MVENIVRSLSERKKSQETPITSEVYVEEIMRAAKQVARPVVFAVSIITIVYLPILTLQGIEGKMFGPMAQTVSFAILGAFLLSLTYLPMMSALVISKKMKHKATISDKMMNVLERWYQHALEKVLQFKTEVTAHDGCAPVQTDSDEFAAGQLAI